jgi:Carboxypeptidase regulatory-like domain
VKIGRSAFLAAVVFAALSAGVVPMAGGGLLGPALARAQNFGERVVTGTVLNTKSEPVSGATVFLENEKTKTIRSFDSDAEGHFNFAQVDMAQDFDLWAEKGKLKSATKVVSSWDARAKWVGELKLK